jgi:hypothetical protein
MKEGITLMDVREKWPRSAYIASAPAQTPHEQFTSELEFENLSRNGKYCGLFLVGSQKFLSRL